MKVAVFGSDFAESFLFWIWDSRCWEWGTSGPDRHVMAPLPSYSSPSLMTDWWTPVIWKQLPWGSGIALGVSLVSSVQIEL